MRTNRLFAASFAALLCPLLNSPMQAQWPSYRVTYLGEGEPWDLNDSTVVLAQSMTGTGGSKIWKDGVWRSLPSLLDVSVGMRINNAVQTAGDSYDVARNIIKATGWPNTSTVADLGTLPGTNNSRAFGINSEGVIVGVCWFDTNSTADRYQAFTHSGSMAPLPPWGTPTGQYGMGINDSGDVVTYQFQPFMTVLYRGGAVTEVIPDFAGYAVNNRKVIAGDNTITWGPAYWSDGTLVSLPNPPGGSTITDINDAGTMVGYRKSNVRGLIWKNGEVRILEELTLQSCVIEVARAINKKGEILCRGHLLPAGTTGVLLLTPVGKMTVPLAGATWIAGEEDTIRWTDIEKGVMLTVELSTDSGGTYRELVSHIPADSGKCGAHMPKDVLSTKCLIRLRDANTLNNLAESELFKIKPYLLTRIDPAIGNYVAYTVPRDQWGFWNTKEDVWPYLYWYTRFSYSPGIDPFTGQPFPIWTGDTTFANAKDSDYPSWTSFVRVFSVDACYISLSLAVYSRTALEWWGWARDSWGGSCFGIAGTNALAFSNRQSFLNKYPGLPLVDNPISVVSDTAVIAAVSEIYSYQYGKPSIDNDLVCEFKTPTETLTDLKRMMREDTSRIRTLTIRKYTNPPGAHTILAYKVDRQSDDSPIWNVHVYDNSYPSEPDAIIEIDTSQNLRQGRWEPAYGTYKARGWGDNKGIYLEVPSENYLTLPMLEKRPAGSSVFHLAPGRLNINSTRGAFIRIRDAAGKVTGYAGDQVLSDIPGSAPMMVKNGSSTPPYGYALASGNYSIALDSFKTSESRVSFFTENRTLGYQRSGADVSQTDNLRFDTTGGPAVSLANLNSQPKLIRLKNILRETNDEQVYTIHSLDLAPSDSLMMMNVGGNALRLASYGSAKDYDIRVDYASRTGLRTFERANIPLTANTTHTIVPDWGTLGYGLLVVLVDRGNDGTVDDTLHLQNEATGIQDHGSLIPNEYRLEQNYPNPFNPVTTIRYGLPQKSAVRLIVYSLLGQEVATLVQEEQEVGYHEVRFDGSGLASGMYIYRLKVGDFVQSRKLILLH